MDELDSTLRTWRFPESTAQHLVCLVRSQCPADQIKNVTFQEEQSSHASNLPAGESLNGSVVSVILSFQNLNQDAEVHVALAVTNTDAQNYKLKARTQSGEWEDIASQHVRIEGNENVDFLQTTVTGTSYTKKMLAVVSTNYEPKATGDIFIFEHTNERLSRAFEKPHIVQMLMVEPTDIPLKKSQVLLTGTHIDDVEHASIPNKVISHAVGLRIVKPQHRALKRLVVGMPHFEPAITTDKVIVTLAHYGGSDKWLELEPCSNTERPDVEKIDGLDKSVPYCWSLVDLSKTDQVTMVVTVRETIDSMTCGQQGGLLRSTVDNAVSINVPSSALPEGSKVSLKVLNLNNQVLDHLKTEDKGLLKPLQDVTPVYRSYFSARPSKAIKFTAPVPRKWSRKKAKGKPKRQLSANELLHLLLRSASGTWDSKEDLLLDVNDDNAHFELDNPQNYTGYRLMITDNDKTIKKENLSKMAERIDAATDHHIVNFLFLQKVDNEYMAYVDCVDGEKAENVIDKCARRGYKSDVLPSKDVLMKDGQKVSMTFGGNVCPAHPLEEFEHFVFSSSINNARREMLLTWAHANRQKELLKFVGYIKFFTIGDGCQQQEALCKFDIEIPKPEPQKSLPRRESDLVYQHPFGDAYFNDLADKLSASDMDHLKQHPEFQSKHTGSNTLRMFQFWYKNQPKNHDKVAKLGKILQDIGRSDLSTQLGKLADGDIPVKPPNSPNREEAFKAVIANSLALQKWKTIGRKLGVPEAELTNIESRNRDDLSECCYKMLKHWHDREGSAATPSRLASMLRTLEMVKVAEDIEDVCNLK